MARTDEARSEPVASLGGSESSAAASTTTSKVRRITDRRAIGQRLAVLGDAAPGRVQALPGRNHPELALHSMTFCAGRQGQIQ